MTESRRPIPDGRVRVVPSLLAADFADLAGALRSVEAETDWVSVDIMDGHFVPNLSFGPDAVSALRRRSRVALDAHLMVEHPECFAPVFADAGADFVVGHVEALRNPDDFFRPLESRGVGRGLGLKPATPASALLALLDRIDLALVMTVEPGFGGQEFLLEMTAKVRQLREAIDRSGRPVWLMVDGGINEETAAAAALAGADALVAGSAVFRDSDPAAALRRLRERAQANFKGLPKEGTKTWR